MRSRVTQEIDVQNFFSHFSFATSASRRKRDFFFILNSCTFLTILMYLFSSSFSFVARVFLYSLFCYISWLFMDIYGSQTHGLRPDQLASTYNQSLIILVKYKCESKTTWAFNSFVWLSLGACIRIEIRKKEILSIQCQRESRKGSCSCSCRSCSSANLWLHYTWRGNHGGKKKQCTV